MNIFDVDIDVEILKGLLSESSKSLYDLEKELEKKLGKENVNYATILRKCNKLLEKGFIDEEKGLTKKGKEDKRVTRIESLSFKGLVFLALNANLSDAGGRAIFRRLSSKPKYQKIDIPLLQAPQIASVTFLKSFEKIKPKVNSEYYDEKYVRNLWYDSIIKNFFHVLSWKEKLPKEKRDLERYVKKARRGLPMLSPENVRKIRIVYGHLTAKRDSYASKANMLKPVIAAFDKAGVKS
jgi:hypothetical protein